MKKFSLVSYYEVIRKSDELMKSGITNKPELLSELETVFKGKFSLFMIKQCLNKYQVSINRKLDVLGRQTKEANGQL